MSRSRLHRLMPAAVVAAAMAVALGVSVLPTSAQTLVGAIDLHAHGDPDGCNDVLF